MERLRAVKQEVGAALQRLPRPSRSTALLVTAVIGLGLAISPLALKAPAAGVDRLLDQLQRDSSSTTGKEVAAQTLRVLFASQPWARTQIADHQTALPFSELLRSSSRKLVEQSACLLADLTVFNASSPVSQQSLADTVAQRTCTPTCQKCLISLLSSQASTAQPQLRGLALHRALQWAGILPFEDLAALRLLTSDAATAATALVINQAASSEGRTAMASSLPLVNALLRALRISATSSHIEAAAGAARLVGNLSPDPRFVGLLQESHSLEPLLRALLRRVQARDPETLPACAIAISNLAAGSPRARAALGAMSGSTHMAEAAADASTGAAHMALLQAMLATSQEHQLTLEPKLAAGLQHQAASWDVPQNLVALLQSQLQGASNHPQKLPHLQGLSLCSPTGACYSLHHSLGPEAQPPPLQLAQLHAIQNSGCGAVAGALGSSSSSSLEAEGSGLVAAGQQVLQHVSCYGSRRGSGGESVAWMVSRQDPGADLGPWHQEPVWTGLGLGTAWKMGELGASLGAAQAVAAARISGFWDALAWPVLRPYVRMLQHTAEGLGSVGNVLLGQLAGSLRDLLWSRTTRPLLGLLWGLVQQGLEGAVWPLLLQVSEQVKAAFAWVGPSVLRPIAQVVGHSLAAVLNSVAWAVLALFTYVFEYLLQPLLGVLVHLLVELWHLLYVHLIAPFAGVIVALTGTFSVIAALLHKCGISIMPRWRRQLQQPYFQYTQ